MPNPILNKRIFTGSVQEAPNDPDAEAFFAAALGLGYPVNDTWKSRITNTYLALKSQSQYTHLASLHCHAWGDTDAEGRAWATIDMITPTRLYTFKDAYSGDFNAGVGFIGDANSFGIYTNFNPGDGGTYTYTQNNCAFGFLTILDLAQSGNPYEMSCFPSGYAISSGAFAKLLPRLININGDGSDTLTYRNKIVSTSLWYHARRLDSNKWEELANGVRTIQTQSTSTAIENKMIALLSAYDGTFNAGTQFYSQNKMALSYFGDSTLDPNTLMNIFNSNIFEPQSSIALKNNRLIARGDSRTWAYDFPLLSNDGAYPRKVLTNNGINGWGYNVISIASETLASMDTDYATQIGQYANDVLTKDVLVIWAGTNDIAAGDTGADVYASMVSFCTKAKADGYTVIVVGEIDRNWTSYVAMNIQRTLYRTLLLADFLTPTSVTNVYTGAAWADFHIDIYAEVNFQSYLSAWYHIDGIHPNTTGSEVVGDYVSDTLTLIP